MDLSDVVSLAKESMLQNGRHAPTFYVETEKKTNMIALGFFPDTSLERQKLCFALGRRFGSEYPGVELQHVYFVSEAWATITPLQGEVERKEVLTVGAFSFQPGPEKTDVQSSMCAIEILRLPTGAFHGLQPLEQQFYEAEHKLLVAFLAGFAASKLSEEEFAATVRRVQERRA